MQSILVLVCTACLSLSCFAQDTTETQPSTDAVNTFEWDTTSTSLTTSDVDPQTENSVSPRNNDDYSRSIANQWGPLLLPMKLPSYGDRIYNRKARYEVKDAIDNLYPFLRRPDAYPTDWNDTVSPEYAAYQMNTGYAPYPSSELFYSRPIPTRYLQRPRYPEQIDSTTYPPSYDSLDVSDQQNISASTPAAAFYRSPFSRMNASPENNPFAFFNYPPLDFFLRNRAAAGNPEGAYPITPFPYPPGFFPPGGPEQYPQVNVFVQPPYGDSESIPQDNLPERRQSQQPTGPFSPTSTAVPNLPLGSPVPLQPISPDAQPNLPLPPRPFPFGYPPVRPPFPVIAPGLIPRPTPILPNIPASPNNNLMEGPIPEVPSLPLKPVDAPVDNLPPTGDVPEVVNVDVFDSETAKPGDGPSANIPYKFGYDMNDGRGTGQHREESADEAGVVTGSYGYRDLYGVYRLVTYIADKDGFRASVKSNEPGVANPGSADVVVLAERPPLRTVAEGLRHSDIDVTLVDEPTDLEIETSEKK